MRESDIQFQVFNGPETGSARPWFSVKNREDDSTEISIYDTIGKDWWSGEGVEGKKFIEQLKEIPASRNITLRINSPGGNVHDGLLIYNRLSERKEHVTVIVDGVAASIASIIAMAGKTIKMPANALLMIHDPWGVAQGNADEMRRAAEMLEKHKDSLVSIYTARSGMSEKEVSKMMSAETWFTGADAKEAGFCDEVTDQISIQACFDFSRFAKAPDFLKTKNQPQNAMNKAKIIAKLKKLGVEFDESATEDQLMALLEDTLSSAADAKAQADADAKTAKAKAKADAEAKAAADADAVAKAKADADAKAAASNPSAAAMVAMQKDLDAMKARFEGERKTRIESEVDAMIAEDRVPGAQRDAWVARCIADEGVLASLRSFPARAPGAASANVIIVEDSPQSIATGITDLRKPLASWLRGNHVSAQTISANAQRIAAEITRHRKRLDHVLATNTVDTDLKRNVILSDQMRAFKRKLIMLGVFSTRFTNVPLEGTNKIIVPFFELDTTTSKDFVAADGYVFDQDTDAGKREVTINKRKYKPMEFSSDEFRRQPYFNPPQSMLLKAEQLGVDVWLDVLSEVTTSNFGAPVLELEPSTMDVDDIVTLRKLAQNADWPDMGRALVLGTEAEAAILQDETLKHYLNSGSTEPLRAGATGRLLGFDLYASPRLPTNSEDLAAFICMPAAILVATAPIAPAPGVRSQLLSYDLVTDPETGISFEYRYWGHVDKDKDREVVECNYGYKKGNASALKIINAAATINSSSSSQSSVNSSSSSSST